MSNLLTYESKLDEINRAIERRRHKWTLKAVAWMDYDDVAQLLRIHVYNKWHLWDQGRPFARWLSTVLKNRTNNLLRNLYFNIAKPCASCEENDGDLKCRKFGVQCNSCPLYADWEKRKKATYDIKLPVSIESHTQEVYDMPHHDVAIDDTIESLHEKMKLRLSPTQYKIYRALYIDGKSHHEVADLMGYCTSEKTRSPGYKQILNMEKIFIAKAKSILRTG